MHWLVFVAIGIAALWFLPGAVAAIICLSSRRLRDRIVEHSRRSLRRSMEGYERTGATADAVRRRFRVLEKRGAHLMMGVAGLFLSGPHGIVVVRELARANDEIRLD